MGQGSSQEAQEVFKKRSQVVTEFVATEQNYVNNLELIQTAFLNPLEIKAKQNRAIISEEQIQAIFSNIQDIHSIHYVFLEDLNKRMQKWTKKQKLSDIFLAHFDKFKCYTTYVNNYNRSLITITECEKNPKFQEFLIEAKGKAKQPLSSFLIMPIQRIPRYVLLLNEILKKTNDKHKDKDDLKKALAKIQDIADFVNEEKRMAENLQRLLELQNSFIDKLNLMQRHRLLVQEGDFQYMPMEKSKGHHSKAMKQIHFFLFNDYLILAKPKRGVLGTVFVSIVSSDDMWEAKAVFHLTRIGAGPAEEADSLLLTTPKTEYLIKLKSQQDRDTYLATFNEVRGVAHKLPNVEIWQDGEKGEKQKEKKKAKAQEASGEKEGKLKGMFSSIGKVKINKGKDKKKNGKEKGKEKEQEKEKEKVASPRRNTFSMKFK